MAILGALKSKKEKIAIIQIIQV